MVVVFKLADRARSDTLARIVRRGNEYIRQSCCMKVYGKIFKVAGAFSSCVVVCPSLY